MNIKKTSFLLIFVFLCGFFVAAQNKGANSNNSSSNSSNKKPASSSVKKTGPLDRISIGGTLSGGVSNDYYFLTAAPRVSMEVTKWFVPGVTVAYMYAQETPKPYKITTNTYGGGVFARLYPIQYVFGHVEYQHLWYNQKVTGGGIAPEKFSASDNFLLTGVGAKVPVGNKMFMLGSVLFNVLNNEKSDHYMYKNPIYSIGFEVGL